MKKRVSAFLLALVLALGLSACGGPAAGLPSSAPAEFSAPIELQTAAPAETQASDPAEASSPPETVSWEPGGPAAQDPGLPASQGPEGGEPALSVDEDGWYDSKEEVALYIHLYGRLPDNYVTKREAQDLGWSGGSVERYAGEGTAIGGSRFGNYEGLLPEAEGRTYTECDIGTVGSSSRGAQRLVFSNDGLVYYTGDHYESFELLYGAP